MADKTEIKDAEKAESSDDKEDADYKKEAETGRSEEGYIRDDAEKAESADDNEDEAYSDADKQDVLNELDQRYASRKDHEGLKAMVQDLANKINSQHGEQTPEQAQKETINLDGKLED